MVWVLNFRSKFFAEYAVFRRMQRLQSESDVNAKTEIGNTPLHVAACNDNPEIPQAGHLAETKDKEITETNFWSKK